MGAPASTAGDKDPEDLLGVGTPASLQDSSRDKGSPRDWDESSASPSEGKTPT